VSGDDRTGDAGTSVDPVAPVSVGRRVLFLVSSAALAAVTGATVLDEVRPAWSGHWLDAQERLAVAGVEDAEGAVPVRVPQLHVPALGVVDRCGACHAGTDRPELAGAPAPLATHPGPMLELHDPEKVGCTPCHDGQGRATRLPDAHGSVAHWESPLLAGRLVQAGCGRCHDRATVARAPDLRRGVALMDRLACFGCHEMPGAGVRGRVGPELTYAADRASPAWLLAWLRRPADLLATPRMADFGFSERDAADIVAYLLSFRGRAGLPEAGGALESASDAALDRMYEAGGKTWRTARCVSCHAIAGTGGTLGPDHGRIGEKLSVEAIAAWIADPERFLPGTRMPRFRLPEGERLALAYHMSEEMKDPAAAERLAEVASRADSLLSSADAARGRTLVHSLGCLGCHAVAGVPDARPVGPDLTRFGEKEVGRLPFKAGWDGPRTREAWTRAKLESPRSGGETLIMPTSPIAKQDLDALLVAVLSLTAPAPASAQADPPRPAGPAYPPGPAGALVRDLKCLTCHALGGSGGTLAPDLTAEGSRVQPRWLFDFLREPYEIRPLLVERMPRFFLPDAEAELLTTWLGVAYARDGLPEVPADPAEAARGETLFEDLRCRGCHILGERGGAVGPNLSDTGRRLDPRWTAWQLTDPARAGAVEPRIVGSAEDARSLAAFLATRRVETAAPPGGPEAGGAP